MKENFQMIYTHEYSTILLYIQKCKKFSVNELPDEIPDEFCDPLMFSYIQQPVELPEGNIIMDKDVICRHLLTNEFDPFNRSKLTISMAR